MNAIFNLLTMISMLLAAANADAPAKKDSGVRGTPQVQGATAEKIVLNHNETLVRDAPQVEKTSEAQPSEIEEFIPNDPSWFDHLDSGARTVPSMRIAAEKAEETKVEDSWLTRVWNFFFRSSERPPGGDCDEFGCGMNHNQTMVTDTDSATWAEATPMEVQVLPGDPDLDRSVGGIPAVPSMRIAAEKAEETKVEDSWLTRVWNLFFRSSERRPGGCDEWGCGSNHNETMVTDSDSATLAEATPVEVQVLPGEPDLDRSVGGIPAVPSMRIAAEKAEETKIEDSWLTRVWNFFFRSSERRPGGDCDDFGCGMNHNETMADPER